MNPNTDKLIRRTTMIGTVVAAYFLLTADYGSQPNVLDPVRTSFWDLTLFLQSFDFFKLLYLQEKDKGRLKNAKFSIPRCKFMILIDNFSCDYLITCIVGEFAKYCINLYSGVIGLLVKLSVFAFTFYKIEILVL
ncbi:Protein translocation protein SEC63 [Bienertia sinuspersici]